MTDMNTARPQTNTPAVRDASHLTAAAFRAFLEAHRTGIAALRILSDPRSKRQLTKPMLKELRQAMQAENPAWNEDSLWQAYAATAPDKVQGCSSEERFADLVPLVRFALELQPVLEPYAESLGERFAEWVTRKNCTFMRDQLLWLDMIRDRMGTSLSIEMEDFERPPFSKRGGLKKARRVFGKPLLRMLEELNAVLAA